MLAIQPRTVAVGPLDGWPGNCRLLPDDGGGIPRGHAAPPPRGCPHLLLYKALPDADTPLLVETDIESGLRWGGLTSQSSNSSDCKCYRPAA